MIYDFHNKLTYVLSFFIAFRPFPGLPFILSLWKCTKSVETVESMCIVFWCHVGLTLIHKSHSGIKQRPVDNIRENDDVNIGTRAWHN